ncbi:Putative rmlC-like cupin domain superfamily, rmlC-like jelly roll, chrR-like cupin protein [Septoria linicola]|uniref:RmlC-like cupin domain superfamily, rmlC-like jelly roll, chrR-like cupin protein n=1 Tax=Septoria linicola TaxID=215465 RepID=A0A9Q9B363_9PEZI|nr:putative rmlC-like cupin domain superfamily, rmlC-like jelly roll, chrR-like cupin protein [Septoria linicola]USW57340.1 Putative rmlC-like cupin domain superfamily, rmlC-like jelly roll, chrR-like cupin protein [Septoria linicola]
MPKPEIEFKPTASFPKTESSGLITQSLSMDNDTGDSTVLLTYPAGSRWGEPICKHEYWEEVYIISGRIYDEGLKQWFGAGDYCCRPPGMVHGPFLADEVEGCREICWLRYPRRDEAVAGVKPNA